MKYQSTLLISFLLSLCLFTPVGTSNIPAPPPTSIPIPTRKLDSEGIIKADFQMVTKNKYPIVLLEMGVPEQQLNLVIDIGSERTWVHNSIFSSQTSSHYASTNFLDRKEQDEFSYSGVTSTDRFTFESVSMEKFDFLFVDKLEGNTETLGGLSLGREYDSKRFSFVYRLSAATKTFFNSFSLQFNDTENKGTLYIGDLSKELQEEAYLMDTCELVNIAPKIKWACTLTHSFVGQLGNDVKIVPNEKDKLYSIYNKQSKVTSINSPAFFETIYNKIFAPMYFIEYLIQNYFIDTEHNNAPLCTKEYNAESKETSFKCSSFEITKLPNLNFVFGGNLDLFMNSNDLFICLEESCEFLIYNKEKITNWIIGLPLLKNYHIVFDYNNPILTFHGREKKAKVQMEAEGGNSVLKGIVLFIIIVASLILATIGVRYLLRRKNGNRQLIQNQIYEQFNASSL